MSKFPKGQTKVQRTWYIMLSKSWFCLRHMRFAGFSVAMTVSWSSTDTRCLLGDDFVPSMKPFWPLPRIAGKTWVFLMIKLVLPSFIGNENVNKLSEWCVCAALMLEAVMFYWAVLLWFPGIVSAVYINGMIALDLIPS